MATRVSTILRNLWSTTAHFYQARLTRSFTRHYAITPSTQLVQNRRVAIGAPKGSRWQTSRMAAVKLSSEIAEPEQADPEVHSEGSPMPPESTQQQEYTLEELDG